MRIYIVVKVEPIYLIVWELLMPNEEEDQVKSQPWWVLYSRLQLILSETRIKREKSRLPL
jgi:hypothetical protein